MRVLHFHTAINLSSYKVIMKQYNYYIIIRSSFAASNIIRSSFAASNKGIFKCNFYTQSF